MPAPLHQRQPETAPQHGFGWFGTPAGQALLQAEAGAVRRVLAACPALPWAWVGVPAARRPEARRGVLLHRADHGLAGSLRCRLPLPLAGEAFGAVLVQHALDLGDDRDELLGECARILAPGGTLWLSALNPWTPYRARWARSGLHARDPGRWHAALRRAGFSAGSVSLQWLGPRWDVGPGEVGVAARDRVRAAIALTVSKRVRAAIPPAPLRVLRWQAGPRALSHR